MDLDGHAFVKRGHTLVPRDFVASEYLDGLPEGCEVLIRITRPRSIKHHRWFFALLHVVIDNTDDVWANKTDLLEDLKDAVGHVELDATNVLTRKRRRRTRSISFASMPEDQFIRFRDRCLYVLKRELGWDPAEVMEEIDARMRHQPTRGS